MITAYKETQKYLNLPGEFSKDANGKRYEAYSEHVMLAMEELLSSSSLKFPHLTEILFSRELVDSSLSMTNESGRKVSNELFRSIGHACPNLRVRIIPKWCVVHQTIPEHPGLVDMTFGLTYEGGCKVSNKLVGSIHGLIKGFCPRARHIQELKFCF